MHERHVVKNKKVIPTRAIFSFTERSLSETRAINTESKSNNQNSNLKVKKSDVKLSITRAVKMVKFLKKGTRVTWRPKFAMSEKFCGKFAVGRIMMKRKKDTYNRVKWRGNNRIIIERSLNDIDILSEDKYAKDDHRTTCSHKSIINERLVTMGQDVLDKPISKQHALVLDGRYTRTSKTLIGGGFRGKNITVPNDTSSFYHMYDANQVHAVPFSLADQVLITKKETYDLVYFDVCAFFESKYNDGPSLKDVIKTSFERQIYTPNAILALTICTRNASGVDYKGQEQGHALSWVIQQANLHGYTCTPYYDGALHAYPMYVTLFFVLSKK